VCVLKVLLLKVHESENVAKNTANKDNAKVMAPNTLAVPLPYIYFLIK